VLLVLPPADHFWIGEVALANLDHRLPKDSYVCRPLFFKL
jgi:hypothetical protein